MDSLDELEKRAVNDVVSAKQMVDLQRIKAKYLGRTGELTTLLRGIQHMALEERRTHGGALNAVRQRIESLLKTQQEALQQWVTRVGDAIDVTLPARRWDKGSLHPLTQVTNRIERFFCAHRFQVISGPQIETTWFNFTALNTPADHPARSMQDTFYLDGDYLLRTHTSAVQVRHLLHTAPPVRILSPGRVYRIDSDTTHSPMFFQVEGLCVDRCLSFVDLKAMLRSFFTYFFAPDKPTIRFRGSFFPFTEPSAEVDVSCVLCTQGCRVCGYSGWLEVAGCGMVHPQVLQTAHIHSDHFGGFAFGIGIDRLTMLYYGIDDVRLLYEGDMRFLTQF